MTQIKKIGSSTFGFESPPAILAYAAIVGKKEGEGPYGKFFDKVEQDAYFGKDTWETAESALFEETVLTALKKASLSTRDIDILFAGDLLNQCTATGYAAVNINIPYMGLYGACSTMAESLLLASCMVAGGVNCAIAATGSHFCGSEKQFRFPLEYGSQRPPTSQWTVTGAGAVILDKIQGGPYITHATVGKVFDAGIKDAGNMGAAMAPAFCDTLVRHLTATNTTPSDYDMIFSGDLGHLGKKVAADLILAEHSIDITPVYEDCGCMIFDPDKQDVHSGGSGCGCSASMLAGYILPQMRAHRFKRVLFIATGALMSPTMSLQGASIPSVAHAIEFNVKAH